MQDLEVEQSADPQMLRELGGCYLNGKISDLCDFMVFEKVTVWGLFGARLCTVLQCYLMLGPLAVFSGLRVHHCGPFEHITCEEIKL